MIGVDYASVDGGSRPNFRGARVSGSVGFAIIRADWGVADDGFWDRDAQAARDAGLVVGPYLFLREPRSGRGAPSPEAQARALVRHVGPLQPGDLPPALDVEYPGQGREETGKTAEQLLDDVRAAWRVLRAAYGCAPIVYTSARVWREDLRDAPAPDLTESPLWLAHYAVKENHDLVGAGASLPWPATPPPWGDPGNSWLHQFQGDATGVPGFSVSVDANRFRGLRLGDRGDRVRWLQRRLGIGADGVFGMVTSAAVGKLQKAAGLVPDGVVGIRTFAVAARLP